MWRDLPIVIRRKVRQRTGYRKQSVLLSGRGFHIHGMREFEAGDSPRALSRKHLVRTGAQLVMEKHAGHGAFVLVLLDISASGRVGAERIKHEASLELLRHFASACIWQGNMVQILAFTTRVEFESALLANTSALDEALGVLGSLRPASTGTDPAEALDHALRIAMSPLRPADLACIISDMFFPEPRDSFFMDMEDLSDACDVVALVMRDRVDMDMPPLRGGLRVRDIESGEVLIASAVKRSDTVEELERFGIDTCVLLASQSDARWHEALSDFFTERLDRR